MRGRFTVDNVTSFYILLKNKEPRDEDTSFHCRYIYDNVKDDVDKKNKRNEMLNIFSGGKYNKVNYNSYYEKL